MKRRWLERLSNEDTAFLKRFLLASGSLKAVAKIYDVSYPTIRQRLNRLIAKVEVFDSDNPMSEFERTLRAAFAESKIDQPTLERLLSAHRDDLAASSGSSAANDLVASDSDEHDSATGNLPAAASSADHPARGSSSDDETVADITPPVSADKTGRPLAAKR